MFIHEFQKTYKSIYIYIYIYIYNTDNEKERV